MRDKIIAYLEAKGIKIDDEFLRYLDGKVELTDQDEYMHVFEPFPHIIMRVGTLILLIVRIRSSSSLDCRLKWIRREH